MAQRDDITVRWDLSPRLITIAAPSTEIIVQDLHDTLRELEAQQQNLIYDSIIETAGGENLGGSTTVGLTATLQNACISFEARLNSVSDGYASNIDITETILTDSTATFVSDSVARGALLINFDDFSGSTVVKVISETQLEIEPLRDGVSNTWVTSPGDYYKIWNQVTCNISGGNLVAVDENGSDIDPVCPTAMVQVVRSSASSATSTFSQDIEFASFNGGVTVDTGNITGLASSGTNFPTGTVRRPCDNLSDALSIASERGLDTIFIKGNIVIDDGLDFSDLRFVGGSVSKTSATITSAANVESCEFEELTMSGSLDGYSLIRNCVVGDIVFFNGTIIGSELTGTVILAGGLEAHLIGCSDGLPGNDTPIIDMGGSGQALSLADYTGGIKIINKTGTDPVTIDIDPGRVVLDSTVTNGPLIIRGVGSLEDNSTGSANIDSLNLIEGIKIQRLAYDGFVHVNANTGTPGQEFGINGLPSRPVDTIADAIVIGNVANLNKIKVSGFTTLTENLSGWSINAIESRATFDFDGYDIENGTFNGVTLTGTIPIVTPSVITNLRARSCTLTALENPRGIFEDCIILGTVTAHPGAPLLFTNLKTDESSFRSSTFQIPPLPTEPPTLNINGGEVTVQGFDGYMILENVNTADSYAVISMNAGCIYIAPSCNDGTIVIRGTGQIINAGTSSLDTTGSIGVEQVSSDIFNKLFPFVAKR